MVWLLFVLGMLNGFFLFGMERFGFRGRLFFIGLRLVYGISGFW